MKKIILASVVASALLGNSYEVTPMVGYVNTKDHVDIENHAVVGISASRVLNEESKFSSLEIGLLQSGNADYDNNMGDTKITQIFYNALKDYKINDTFKVYALAGLGYEHISSEKLGNESDPFFNYGVGAAYTFANDLALKLDVRHQLKFDGDKNIVTLLGLSIPFGSSSPKTTKKEPIIKEEPTVVEKDSILDSDKDGVIDSLDRCKTTPLGTVVDKRGCEILNTPDDLGIFFEVESAKIEKSDVKKLKKYALFLNEVTESKVVLEAHTDSDGTKEYNLELSKDRAESAKTQLISMGVEANRIDTMWYGETRPLLPNTSEKNKAKNRRVTAQIVD